MAKIVESEKGYWVGKEISEGSRYIAGYQENYFKHPTEKILNVTTEEIYSDIFTFLKVHVNDDTPVYVVKELVSLLCHKRIGIVIMS